MVENVTKADLAQHDGIPELMPPPIRKKRLMASELPNRLIAQGFRLVSMMLEQMNLETAFMRLTKGLVAQEDISSIADANRYNGFIQQQAPGFRCLFTLEISFEPD